MLDKNLIKKSLTQEHLVKIFELLGVFLPPKQTQGGLIFPTRCHNKAVDAENYKLYYYFNTCLFKCYTDCSDTFDIFEFIIRAKTLDGEEYAFPDALYLVSTVLGVDFSNEFFIQEIHRIKDWDFIQEYNKNRPSRLTDLAPYPEEVLEVFSYNTYPWESHLINRAALEKFKIGYYHPHDKIVIPHFDRNGKLIGIRGRAMRQEDLDAGRKYMPITVEKVLYSHPLSFNLYGMWENRKAINRTRRAIIFEAEKSVLQCETYYGEYNNSLAVCGSNISKYQRDLLLKTLDVEEVVIAFDKEYDKLNVDGQQYEDKVWEIARKFSPYVRTYILMDSQGVLGKKDSPSDRGQTALEELLKFKIEVKTKR